MRVPRSLWMAALLLASLVAGCINEPGLPAGDPGLTVPADVRHGSVSGLDPTTYSVFPGDYRFDTDVGSQTLVNGTYEALLAETIVLTSDLDGADIEMTVWLPEVHPGAQVPAIIQASPYFSDTTTLQGSQDFGVWMHDTFVPHGYAYVQLAIRSTGESGGCDDFRGPDMVADMDQAITWIAEQDWSNGNVALIGKSYPGSTPWYAAGAGNPAIKTIVPVSGSTNAWEVYNRNGTPEVRSAIIVPTYGATAAGNDARSTEHKAENFACLEVYEAWGYGVTSGVTAERVGDAWWDERNAKPKVAANYEGSVLLVHGLEDWNVDPAIAIPWTQQLADQGLKVKQFLGQWAHDHPDRGSDATLRWDWAEVLLRWFDAELKGADVDTGPAVQVQSNDGRWRDEASWPPADADWQRLGITTSGELKPNGEDEVQTKYLNAAQPLEYRMEVVNNDLHIAGLPKVHLTVVPTGPSGYIGAFLYDEAPDGERTRIGWTGMNLRYADGTEDPKLVVPGQSMSALLEIQPMDAVVPAGHTLVLRLSATETPEDRIPPAHPEPVGIVHGGEYGLLKLPFVDRDPQVFFIPPLP